MKLSIEQALQQGIAAHRKGKLREAERLYRAILHTKPLHPDANHNLGVIAVAGKNIEAALPLFKISLEANPHKEQFWLSYIAALIEVKQFDNAKQVLDQANQRGVDGGKLYPLEAQLLTQAQRLNSVRTCPPKEQLSTLVELYKNGQFIDAVELARKITKDFPENRIAFKILGAALRAIGRKSEAMVAIQKTVSLSPQDAPAHSNLGVTLKELGELAKAEASCRQAIAIKPGYAEAHNNLGATLQELGRLDEARASYAKAVELKPDYTEAHYNLGNTLREIGRLDDAAASYRKAIRCEPEHSSAKHLLAALTGQTSGTAPRDYIEGLFDNYAANFEVLLVSKLEYKIPKVTAEMIMNFSKSDSLGSIMDLGCGTGLFGLAINQFCDHLEGIDLSEQMLEKAKEKNVYDNLVKQDILDYLSNANLNFDYFISTDVFIYIGDLSDVFRLIKSRNKTRGKLVFSTEDYDGDDFFLEKSGRYSHSKKYIEGLCEKFGFELRHFEIQTLRKDKGQHIMGGLYLLEF